MTGIIRLSRKFFVTVLGLAAFLGCLSPCTNRAVESADIPADPPVDAIMATPTEIQQMQDWSADVFAEQRLPGREPAIRVEVRRQDHSVLQYGRSCIDTPLRIGSRDFKHGLGTHANSEIVLHLPPDSKEFKAWAGIDNNFDTGGVRGSVQFSVEANGQELFRTPTITGSNEPVLVQVALAAGTREITLKVDATPDGPAYDQADWAEARVVTATGQVLWVDEDRPPFLADTTPFSFRYHGVASSNLLSTWSHTVETSATPSRRQWTAQWQDPQTGLRLTATVTAFQRYPAVDWMLEFENRGHEPTPLLEDIQPLDIQLRSGYFRKPVRLHHLVGDVCGERSFLPLETEIEPGKPLVLAPDGGRPSNGAFPFFNVQYGDEGVLTAIGWSGQWQASLTRVSTGPTTLRAGLEKTALRLQPGERIRTPRILVLPWQGDRLAAHNRWRRLLLFEYAPRQQGRPLRLPIALQCYDRYIGTRADWGSEACQLQAAAAAQSLGCDAHWLDAAWFEGGFPSGAGNWFCAPQRYPNGLGPLSEACHRLGLKFILWFEPERVAPATQIAREHPEFVFGGAQGGLFRLNDPAARRWLGDLLSRRISEFGVDTYRNDFNFDPLGSWRGADAADRQGITEMHYVEGQYALWDELLARHPGLAIDNCASGGRRIDLETCKRSVPLWHSDTGCGPGHADWNQSQSYGLNLYVPLFGGCAWTPTAYDVRSAATAGLICQFDFLAPSFPLDAARASLQEFKAIQKFWYGDFYPLTPCSLGPGALIAYQFHRSDLDSGVALFFRRAECPYPVLQASLRGLRPDAVYQVEFISESRARTHQKLRGSQLMSDFEFHLPARGSSLLVQYHP